LRRLPKKRLKPKRAAAERFIINVVVIHMNLTHISGGVIGALNVGGIQTVQSIDLKIGELLKDPNSQDIANALKELTEAIASRPNTLTEQQRDMALQQLELLGQQASVPANQRSGPIVHALVNTLANAPVQAV
jgi:hypothetical protein